MTNPILEVSGLNVVFRGARRPIPAVRGIDLRLEPGEVLGLVGESGSGKSARGTGFAAGDGKGHRLRAVFRRGIAR